MSTPDCFARLAEHRARLSVVRCPVEHAFEAQRRRDANAKPRTSTTPNVSCFTIAVLTISPADLCRSVAAWTRWRTSSLRRAWT